MTPLLQLLAGFAMIAAILAVLSLAGYVLWWFVLIAISRVPMIGQRHRHSRWDTLNRP